MKGEHIMNDEQIIIAESIVNQLLDEIRELKLSLATAIATIAVKDMIINDLTDDDKPPDNVVPLDAV